MSQIVGDVIDRKATGSTLLDLGSGEPVYLVIQVTTAYSGGTSAQFQLSSDSTADLATARINHLNTGAVAVASLTAGTTFSYALPMEVTYKRYVGIWLTTVGAVATGAINAFLTQQPESWTPAVDGTN